MDWDAYARGEIDVCHLCRDKEAVTSDGVCSDCEAKHPRKPKPANSRSLVVIDGNGTLHFDGVEYVKRERVAELENLGRLAKRLMKQKQATIERLRGALEHIAYNISMSMPAAHGHAESWYRGQLGSAISHAARTLAGPGEGE